MKYFSNTQECPDCKELNKLFIEGPPHSDFPYSYIFYSCKTKNSFKPAIGINEEVLPDNAQIIKPV